MNQRDFELFLRRSEEKIVNYRIAEAKAKAEAAEYAAERERISLEHLRKAMVVEWNKMPLA